MILSELADSPALWNRTAAELDSDEVLAQVLDLGTVADWRVLYRIARTSPEFRRRILRICRVVPIGYPNFFIAAMGALGEPVDPWPEVADPDAAGTA